MRQHSFTLIELLVAVGIVAVLASVVVANLSRTRARANDNKRKTDLLSIQAALELHFAAHRRYPSTMVEVRCAGTIPFCGEFGNGGGKCYRDGCSPGPYIPGLAPTFLGSLPSDPRQGQSSVAAQSASSHCNDNGWAGYGYASDGIEYKLVAHCSAEILPSTNDQFYDPNRPGSFVVYTAGAKNWLPAGDP